MYTVTWAIHVEASSPEKAADLAFKEMRDPESSRTWFAVQTDGSEPVIVDPLSLRLYKNVVSTISS